MSLRSTIVIFVLTFAMLGLLGYAAPYDSPMGDEGLLLTTDKAEYNREEAITFTAKNLGSPLLVFPDSALGITIRNTDTGTAYSIIAAQVLTPIQRGESRTVIWQQPDEGAEVGSYVASINTVAESSPGAAAKVLFKIK